MLAWSENYHSVSHLLLDFCRVIVYQDRKIVQFDVYGVVHFSFITCCLPCISPKGHGKIFWEELVYGAELRLEKTKQLNPSLKRPRKHNAEGGRGVQQ